MPENIIRTALFFLAGWMAARLVLPGMLVVAGGAGFVRPNFRGEEIPTGMGVVMFLSGLAVATVSALFWPDAVKQKAAVFLLSLAGYTCLGLMDDIWGCGRCKGLAGHMKNLLRGRLTTGSIKALAGGILALFIAAAGGDWPLVPLDTLILALSVNMINLLDLRPGRAGKCFLALAAAILAAFPLREETAFLAVTAGSLLAYLPADLKARAMMGDAGSNALGAVLGVTAIWLFDLKLKVLYLAILLTLHLLTEKRSLTKIISANRVLAYLDRLGRK